MSLPPAEDSWRYALVAAIMGLAALVIRWYVRRLLRGGREGDPFNLFSDD